MKKLIIFYDNWCWYCSRFAYFIKKQDFLQKIEAKPLRNTADNQIFTKINFQKATEKMASFNGKKVFYGFDSIYLISKRLPILWLVFPLLFFLKITKIGNIIYREFATKRKIIPLHCDKNTCSNENTTLG